MWRSLRGQKQTKTSRQLRQSVTASLAQRATNKRLLKAAHLVETLPDKFSLRAP